MLSSGAWRHSFLCATLSSAVLLVSGCSTTPAQETAKEVVDLPAPWGVAQGWELVKLPGKRLTRYVSHIDDGRQALLAKADRSASLLRKKVQIEPQALGTLRFSWKANALLEGADPALRETEDAKLRVILSFAGDKSKFSLKNQMLSDMALALTGEEMPYATLMYVWSNQRPVNAVVMNPRTDRIRNLVIESGQQGLGQWLMYERDIVADYKAAFGEHPGALTGIAIMTDADNLQTQTSALYGAIELAQLSGK